MEKYHINPETGNAGKCNATKQCRFGSDTTHYENQEEAQKAAEQHLSSSLNTVSSLSRVAKELIKKQNDAELPQAFKQGWIGREYLNDDVIGNAIDDADYENVNTTYEVTDEGVKITLNFYEETNSADYENSASQWLRDGLFELDPGSYPTSEQITEFTNQLNADWHEDGQLYEDTESIDEYKENILENIHTLLGNDFSLDDVRASVSFKESHKVYDAFDENDVIEFFDDEYGAAANPSIPSETLIELSTHYDEDVRCQVARNLNTPFEAFIKLGNDEDEDVRAAVTRNHNAPALLKKTVENGEPFTIEQYREIEEEVKNGMEEHLAINIIVG